MVVRDDTENVAELVLLRAGLWCTLLAIVLFYLLQHALARVSGVKVGTRTLQQYPSGRAWGSP